MRDPDRTPKAPEKFCVPFLFYASVDDFVQIFISWIRKIDELIEECREHLKLTGENHITWMHKPYQNKRHVIFQLLENLTVLSSIMDEMRIINIVDVIVDVENWLNLSVDFKPLSGNEVRIRDYASRFVATALSYGCNLGPTQTERSLSKFSRKQCGKYVNFSHRRASNKGYQYD